MSLTDINYVDTMNSNTKTDMLFPRCVTSMEIENFQMGKIYFVRKIGILKTVVRQMYKLS